MKSLVINIQPFTFSQNILIYEDGEVVKAHATKMSKLEESILALAYELNITDIKLGGAKFYTKGIQRRIQEMEEIKYDKTSLNITLI